MFCCSCWLLQANGAIVEVEPLCVLDFYVHESCQRQGVGKALFEVRSTSSSSLQTALSRKAAAASSPAALCSRQCHAVHTHCKHVQC
jgi:GNAT superfamily N-acetyltransferase